MSVSKQRQGTAVFCLDTSERAKRLLPLARPDPSEM